MEIRVLDELAIVTSVTIITLKLIGIIDLPWWAATLPFWIGLAIYVLVAVILIIDRGIDLVINKFKSTNRNR